jgi:hypothetical protein
MSEEVSLNVETLQAFVAIAHPFVLYPIAVEPSLALPSE